MESATVGMQRLRNGRSIQPRSSFTIHDMDRRLPLGLGCALAAFGSIGCSKEPCTAVPMQPEFSDLGIPLEGGTVCVSESGFLNIEHLSKDQGHWSDQYVEHFRANGWNAAAGESQPGEWIFHVTKGGTRYEVRAYEYDGGRNMVALTRQ
jgi:hypothetical protein